ncbi:hypothetical protein HZD78_21470 [Mycobacteroides chelonae]|uniref:hypothetical protein n=1 Tax=Mycobacteroides chelonae TaxID=1774 RepID=UPI001C48A310|nr:hypothetical protein [Mycobacteroides chelonae]MBV6362524.1 hypothetical protein [Mycobacteroides chelonae]
MSMSRKAAVTTALVAATLVLPACTSTTPGTATVSASERTVASTTPTSTPRPTSAPDPYAALTKTVQAAMTDTSRFWASEGVVVPTRATIVTDQADAPCSPSRDAKKAAQAVAWACDMVSPQAVVVNPENLSTDIDRPFSDTGVYIAIGHEQSHIGLIALDPAADTDDNTEERRADCGSGAYFGWVVAGQSPSVSVTESDVASTTGAMWSATAPERQKAFVHGFVNGLKSCLTYRP